MDKRQLRPKVSRPNFFHKNQQRPVGNTASNSLPDTGIEIASCCCDFNARDKLNSQRHLSANANASGR